MRNQIEVSNDKICFKGYVWSLNSLSSLDLYHSPLMSNIYLFHEKEDLLFFLRQYNHDLNMIGFVVFKNRFMIKDLDYLKSFKSKFIAYFSQTIQSQIWHIKLYYYIEFSIVLSIKIIHDKISIKGIKDLEELELSLNSLSLFRLKKALGQTKYTNYKTMKIKSKINKK